MQAYCMFNSNWRKKMIKVYKLMYNGILRYINWCMTTGNCVQDKLAYAGVSMGEIHTCQLGQRWVCFQLSYGSGLLQLHPGHNSQMTSVGVAPQGLQKLYHRQWTVYRCLPNTKRAEVHRARQTTREHNHTRRDEETSPVQPIQSKVSSSIHKEKKEKKKKSHTENTHKHLLMWLNIFFQFFQQRLHLTF